MGYRKILLPAAAVLLCICLSSFMQAPSARVRTDYPVNENGQTYGSTQYSATIDTLPDLIHAGSMDETDVYLYRQDLLDKMPKTQEEAIDLAERTSRGEGLGKMQLYEADGKTPAGEITFCPELLPEAVRREFVTPTYPVNTSGQTYGSLSNEAYIGVPPDLVLASGTYNETGYVYYAELEEPLPRTPEEALAIQAARGDEPRYIQLYEVDGVTVIGEFKIG